MARKPRDPWTRSGTNARLGRVGEQVEIAGIKATVVSDAEAEKCDAVVCAALTDPPYFADNRIGPCADCGDLLQWRPHAPKRPPKLCFDCAAIRAGSSAVRERRGG